MSNIKGSIYYRGEKNHAYLRYMIKGKRIALALFDDDHHPIVKGEKAKIDIAVARMLAPLTLKTEADRMEHAAMAIQGIKQKVQVAEAERDRVAIENIFSMFQHSLYCPDCSDSTMIDYARYWKFFMVWLKQNRQYHYLDQITENDIDSYAADLIGNHYSNNTFNKRIGLLKMLFAALLRQKKIKVNPAANIQRKRVISNSKHELTVEQVYKLLSEASGDLAILLGIGYFTGLRMGDCCTLRWSETDLERRIITRLPRKTARRNPESVVKVGINDHLYRALSSLPQAGEYVLPDMAAAYLDHNRRAGLCRRIQQHFCRCGLQTVKPGTGGRGNDKHAIVQYGFHSLRYSYISHQAEAGTAQPLLQKLAGHSNPAMTEHYTRISDDTARRIAGQLTLSGEPKTIILSEEVKKRLALMTTTNWWQIRDELLNGNDKQ